MPSPLAPSAPRILVTGASGVLGSDLLPALLQRWPDADITTVSRKRFSSFAAATRHIEQDLCAPLARNDALREAVVSADYIIHLAANVAWGLPDKQAIEANTRSTERLLGFCRQHSTRLKRFVHMSTAYVQGRTLIDDGTRPCQRSTFNNSYELSKYLSEQAVVDSGLPFAIVRPSLVVGRSDTGYVDAFNGLYYLLRFYCGGYLPVIAGDARATVDVVPVDYVTRATLRALTDTSDGRVYWAISGERSPAVATLVDNLTALVNARRAGTGAVALPPPGIVSRFNWETLLRPMILREAQPSLQRMISYVDVFLPYFSMTGQFSPAPADHVEQSPPAAQYLRTVVDFWCDNNARLINREQRLNLPTDISAFQTLS